MAASIRSGRHEIRISNPEKLLFPADGITKLELASYYRDVERVMRPHLSDRPINLWRWNGGIDGPRVVQQEKPAGMPAWVRSATVAKRAGGVVRHIVGGAHVCVATAQQNCITPHVWSARADRPERPDRIVFDLDPPDGQAFAAVRRAALALGGLLRELGLEPFAMVTGSKGVHVVAPLRRTAEADAVRAAAGVVGQELADRAPEELTTAWRKAGRGGRVLVDTARNTYAQTVVAPYAVRALPGAPVAVPLAWEELDDAGLHPRRWTLRTVTERLDARGDPWAGIARHARTLPAT